MHGPDLIELFVVPLASAGIPHMITGSVASSIYGEPRTTLDIDLVVILDTAQVPLLPDLFPEEHFYLPPVDVIALENRRQSRGHFNIIHHASGLKADIYLSPDHPSFHWAFDHVRRISAASGEVAVAPPEYVILHKLEFFRESGHQRHLRDIAGMIAQQPLDLNFLKPMLSSLGLEEQWRQAVDLANH